ncbi:MAG: citrate transporter, partial [Bacteroidetes bacterium]|nr:citrate transporter [Bacteroidota bacterium]
RSLEVVLGGLFLLLLIKFHFDEGFHAREHFMGNVPILEQLLHKDMRAGEWCMLLNLFGLLMGFAILARFFEQSRIPEELPAILPDDWKGGLMLLGMIMLLSTFLDNIAAAMIGGTISMVVYRGKVHTGYLAAIVAASNAGGAGSVLGDTTTTLMWIDGVNPIDVTHAFVGSLFAFLVFGIAGSLQQDKYHKIRKNPPKRLKIHYSKLCLVLAMLVMAVVTNVFFDFPAIGVWIVIIPGSFFIDIPWKATRMAFKGALFLVALVTCASLMPVSELPSASVSTAFFLGLVSAVFDNIPLTKLCLDQGGFDWGVLAYAVGFGGSMIWFGSSAGVALSNMYPEIKNTGNYVRKGWHVSVAYILGFYLMIALVGWNPHASHKNKSKIIDNQEVINKGKAG